MIQSDLDNDIDVRRQHDRIVQDLFVGFLTNNTSHSLHSDKTVFFQNTAYDAADMAHECAGIFMQVKKHRQLKKGEE